MKVILRRKRKFVLVVPLFLIPLSKFSLAIEVINCPQLYLASPSLNPAFSFYFLPHPAEKEKWQSSLVSIWQAASQGQTHGGNAGETEKVASSFSPQSFCCAHREGPNLKNKTLPEPCALHIPAAGHLRCAELGECCLFQGASVLLPRLHKTDVFQVCSHRV